MFNYKNDILNWYDKDLSFLRDLGQSPLHLINGRAVTESVSNFKKYFESAGLPVSVHFSVKTNPVPRFLKELRKLNVGLETVSEYELWLAGRLGFSGNEIIAGGPAKTWNLFETASKMKVKTVSIENDTELDVLEEKAGSFENPVDICLRICPGLLTNPLDFTLSGSNKKSPHGFENSAKKIEIILNRIKKISGINFKGFHFHLGSGISNSRAYINSLSSLKKLFLIAGKAGYTSLSLNIGGGFKYKNIRTLSLSDLALSSLFKRRQRKNSNDALFMNRIINGLGNLREYLLNYGVGISEIITEPGRILSGPCQATMLTVLEIKYKPRNNIIICDGGAMSLSPMLFTESHGVLPLIKKNGARKYYNVYGNLPSSMDITARNCGLEGIEKGDKLLILDTGAYFSSMAGNFAGPRAGTFFINGDGIECIRKNESFEDIIRLDRF